MWQRKRVVTITELPFSHQYEKLEHPVFPTIRRRDKYGEVGDRVTVTVGHDKLCEAEIIAKEKRCIGNMSKEFLCYDTDTDSEEAAEGVLNSFYRNPIRVTEELTQYVLIKLPDHTEKSEGDN